MWAPLRATHSSHVLQGSQECKGSLRTEPATVSTGLASTLQSRSKNGGLTGTS